mmetsp:Transcript_81618/g.149106  ORF Transcript_81618/g.149106 Transcript_81618/m.149106 type:complete len:408 (+) Transcript_81618:195-1418(+)
MDNLQNASRKIPRFSENAKWLPVIFMVFTITFLYQIFFWCHFYPTLQEDIPKKHRDEDLRHRGIVQFVIFQFVTCMLILCYVRAILVNPGEIPYDDPWMYEKPSYDFKEEAEKFITNFEKKKDGQRRHCKWCGRYKPDRCHHCRVCSTCILKMDHHCPWIYNCVGFHNYKYFFLVLLYAVIDLHLIFWWMLESVIKSWEDVTSFHKMFFLLYGESLTLFLAVLLTLFFSFHVALMFKAMTTIEFCEKKGRLETKGDGSEGEPGFLAGNLGAFMGFFTDTSVYDRGCWSNLTAVFGPNPLLWFFPCSPPEGDGLYFDSAHSRLVPERDMGRDFEVNRGIKPKKRYAQGTMYSYGAPEYSAAPTAGLANTAWDAAVAGQHTTHNDNQDYQHVGWPPEGEGLFRPGRPLI